MPIGIGLVPHAIEPDAADRAIMSEQLRELLIHEGDVAQPIATLRSARRFAGSSPRKIVRMVPVELRVVEKEFDPLPLTFLRQLLERIALERSPVDNVVRRSPGREHREAIVVTRSDCDVSRPGGLGERHPLLGIELDRIELGRQPLVRRRWNLSVLHDPFTVAELGIDAPVDEHAEPGLPEPFARGEAFGGHGRCLRSCHPEWRQEQENRQRYTTHWYARSWSSHTLRGRT